MNFKALAHKLFALVALVREVTAASPSDDERYKYLIRRRDEKYWSGDRKFGEDGWVGRRSKRVMAFRGANNAWHYVENNLYDYIEEIDVVIPL